MESIDAKKGEQIYTFLERMLAQAKASSTQLLAIHNNRQFHVRPGSTLDDLCAAIPESAN